MRKLKLIVNSFGKGISLLLVKSSSLQSAFPPTANETKTIEIAFSRQDFAV